MITGKNESKTSTKHISCECKCKLDCRRHNSNQKWDSDKSGFEKHKICEKNYTCSPAICSCGNGKYLANIMLDSFTFIMKLHYFTLKHIHNIMIRYSQVHPTDKY